MLRKPIKKSQTIGLHSSRAKKLLVMNQKGGVGKSTFTAGLMSNLIHRGFKVELIDFDKHQSSHDWANNITPERSQAYNPSFRSLSNMANTLKVKPDTDFIIFDSPSNFTNEDMVRYTYFANNIILPMAPSPVDLHASLPFIKSIIESGILTKKKINLGFVITRCTPEDKRVKKVTQLLSNFRQYPTLGHMSEDMSYQKAFHYKQTVPASIDDKLWNNVLSWLTAK